MLLIAQPFMHDHNFRRSVILLCDHHRREGTVGFIINKKTDLQISDLVDEFPDFESNIYFGGPVAQETLHYVHTYGDILDESIPIGKGVFWGGNFEKLKFLIQSKLIDAKRIKFFLGYSGWSENQLVGELKRGSWFTSEFFPNYIFKVQPQQVWKQVLSHKGNTYSVIAQMPESQILN